MGVRPVIPSSPPPVATPLASPPPTHRNPLPHTAPPPPARTPRRYESALRRVESEAAEVCAEEWQTRLDDTVAEANTHVANAEESARVENARIREREADILELERREARIAAESNVVQREAEELKRENRRLTGALEESRRNESDARSKAMPPGYGGGAVMSHHQAGPQWGGAPPAGPAGWPGPSGGGGGNYSMNASDGGGGGGNLNASMQPVQQVQQSGYAGMGVAAIGVVQSQLEILSSQCKSMLADEAGRRAENESVMHGMNVSGAASHRHDTTLPEDLGGGVRSRSAAHSRSANDISVETHRVLRSLNIDILQNSQAQQSRRKGGGGHLSSTALLGDDPLNASSSGARWAQPRKGGVGGGGDVDRSVSSSVGLNSSMQGTGGGGGGGSGNPSIWYRPGYWRVKYNGGAGGVQGL